MNRKKLANQLLILAKQLVALSDAPYRYDPHHENQPEGPGWQKTDKGWSKDKGTTQPAQPAQPTQPAQPAQPTQPAKPAQSTQPVQPAKPAEQKPAEKKPAEPAKPEGGAITKRMKEVIDNPSPELAEQLKKLDKPEKVEDFNKRLKSYKLEATGVDEEAAVLVAASLAAGMSETTDTCKVTPPVCEGNLGIERQNMPQLHDKNLKDMLKEADEKDAAGADLEKKAAAETDAAKKKDLEEKAAKSRTDAKEGRAKVKGAVDAGADPNEEKSTTDVFLDLLTKDGVEITGRPGTDSKTQKFSVKDLHATQREIQAKKTMNFANNFMEAIAKPGKPPWSPNQNPLIISTEADGSHCILDGHHRWSAAIVVKPDMEFNCVVVNMPIRDMLTKAHAMPGVYRADLQSNIIDPKIPVDLTGWKPGEEKSTAETSDKATKKEARKKAARKLLLLARAILDS